MYRLLRGLCVLILLTKKMCRIVNKEITLRPIMVRSCPPTRLKGNQMRILNSPAAVILEEDKAFRQYVCSH